MRQHELLEMIQAGTMFGAVEVDVEIPEKLKDRFSEMTSICKKVTIGCYDIGDYMLAYLENSEKIFQNV